MNALTLARTYRKYSPRSSKLEGQYGPPAFGRRPILPLQFLRPLTVFTDTYSPESTYSLIFTRVIVFHKVLVFSKFYNQLWSNPRTTKGYLDGAAIEKIWKRRGFFWNISNSCCLVTWMSLKPTKKKPAVFWNNSNSCLVTWMSLKLTPKKFFWKYLKKHGC